MDLEKRVETLEKKIAELERQLAERQRKHLNYSVNFLINFDFQITDLQNQFFEILQKKCLLSGL